MDKYDQPLKCRAMALEEVVISKLAEKVARSGDEMVKLESARNLITRVEGLLACAIYDENNHDCKLCRRVSELRKVTAEKILARKEIVAAGS